MRIAVPVVGGKLSAHFGHCDTFSLLDVDATGRGVVRELSQTAPPHQPGLLPGWLADHEVDVLIAGGLGTRARDLLEGHGIEVVVGAPEEAPLALAEAYLSGRLGLTGNLCTHSDVDNMHRCSH